MSKSIEASFVSLRNVSKEQGVYEQVRHAITSGQMEAGQRLICAQIGEQLGVSSMPVRNALMRLEAEGLVTRIPHREFVVTPYSSKDIQELYAVRAVLDSFAGRLAAQNVTPEMLEGLQSILSRAEEALAAGNTDALKKINREFHTALCKGAGNRQLQEMIQILQDRSLGYIDAYYALPGIAEKSVEDHRRIVAAFAQGRADLVETYVRQDMENTGEILVKMVAKLEVPSRG